jgi:hypothetical protein
MDFGSDPDILHICINDLQKLLLKVCLMLGIEVYFGVKYRATEWVEEEEQWRVLLEVGSKSVAEGRAGGGSGQDALEKPPSPEAPRCVDRVSFVLAAGGFGCKIAQPFGMRVKETDGLRKESAIGLIVNFTRMHGSHEKSLRSFNMASQFYRDHFKAAKEQTGADLENIVYTKALSSHYFVMTPTHQSLAAAGIIKDRTCDPMLRPDNLDERALDKFCRAVIDFPWKIGQKESVYSAIKSDFAAQMALPGCEPGYADGKPRLFDFSKMQRTEQGIVFGRPGGMDFPPSAQDLFVANIGDALMEPFWPEGLGIIRGFLSVLDVCAAAKHWADLNNDARAVGFPEENQKMVSGRFMECYSELKSLNGFARNTILNCDQEKNWRLDPGTRYRRIKRSTASTPAKGTAESRKR